MATLLLPHSFLLFLLLLLVPILFWWSNEHDTMIYIIENYNHYLIWSVTAPHRTLVVRSTNTCSLWELDKTMDNTRIQSRPQWNPPWIQILEKFLVLLGLWTLVIFPWCEKFLQTRLPSSSPAKQTISHISYLLFSVIVVITCFVVLFLFFFLFLVWLLKPLFTSFSLLL